MTTAPDLMTANEAATVTGVPLRQVHRIIDAGLLDGAVRRMQKLRLLERHALVGLKLAYDTADLLTLEGRKTIVAASIRHPRRRTITANAVTVDAAPASAAVRDGLDRLVRARRMVSSDPATLGGTAVFKGTRIPVHDVAEMLANGDNEDAIIRAFPALDAERLRLAVLYASAYPRRGRPRLQFPKGAKVIRRPARAA